MIDFEMLEFGCHCLVKHHHTGSRRHHREVLVSALLQMKKAPAPLATAAALAPPVLAEASVPPPASTPVPVPASSEPKNVRTVIGTAGWGEADRSSPPALAPDSATSGAASPCASGFPTGRAAATLGLAGRGTAGGASSGGGYTVQVASERSLRRPPQWLYRQCGLASIDHELSDRHSGLENRAGTRQVGTWVRAVASTRLIHRRCVEGLVFLPFVDCARKLLKTRLNVTPPSLQSSP